jgi:hypothetical protein
MEDLTYEKVSTSIVCIVCRSVHFLDCYRSPLSIDRWKIRLSAPVRTAREGSTALLPSFSLPFLRVVGFGSESDWSLDGGGRCRCESEVADIVLRNPFAVPKMACNLDPVWFVDDQVYSDMLVSSPSGT